MELEKTPAEEELWQELVLECGRDVLLPESGGWRQCGVGYSSSESSFMDLSDFDFSQCSEHWEPSVYPSQGNSPMDFDFNFLDLEADSGQNPACQRSDDPPINYSDYLIGDALLSLTDSLVDSSPPPPPSFPQDIAVYQLIEQVISYLKSDGRLSLWRPFLETVKWRRYKTLHAFVYVTIETLSKNPPPGIKAYEYLMFCDAVCELFRAAARDKLQEEFLRPGKSQAFGAKYWKKLWETVTAYAMEQFNVEKEHVVSWTAEIRKDSYWSRYQPSRPSIWEVVVGDKNDTMIRISTDNRYQCKYAKCHEFFDRPGAWRKHFQNYHQKSEKCDFCEKSFSHKKDLERHLGTVHRDLSHIHGISLCIIKCGVGNCDTTSTREDNMNSHRFTKHGVKPNTKRVSPGGRVQKPQRRGAVEY
ncbi:hypothetical protein EX30DRAFT_338658 [Ascodesmis nigricans]|uniref:C2H2-type domain-containing protein n=1 Tax=Ascodesmis nigricans TaxID=341454 RepID=A0A4S2N4M5_9PEZI|nr:hypothetical protein EX30DRAFT_338658 [Ascodesmis nigricans]